MATQQKHVAIEIDSLETWQTLCALQPHFQELDPDENIGNFVVVYSEHEKLVGAICSPGTIAAHFDSIEPNSRRMKFVTINGRYSE